MDNIEDRVLKVVSRQFPATPKATLDELGADSLDKLELVMALEEEFEIDIDDEIGLKFASVQDVIDYIKGRLEI